MYQLIGYERPSSNWLKFYCYTYVINCKCWKSIKIMIIQDIIHISFKYNSSITYHFYLYVKETTSMFKDFAMQFSLPISAISILDKKKYNRDKICHCLQGHVPPSISFKCDYINLRWLEANFVNLQMMRCSSNCYGMFKGFIFISLTRNAVPIYFLPLLEDFDLIWTIVGGWSCLPIFTATFVTNAWKNLNRMTIVYCSYRYIYFTCFHSLFLKTLANSLNVKIYRYDHGRSSRYLERLNGGITNGDSTLN
jgi:hypothetical protein